MSWLRRYSWNTHGKVITVFLRIKPHLQIFSFLFALHSDIHRLMPKILFTRNHKFRRGQEEGSISGVYCFSKYEHQHLVITVKAPNSGRKVERRMEIGTSSPRVKRPFNFKSHFFVNITIRWFLPPTGGGQGSLRIVTRIAIFLSGTFNALTSDVSPGKFYITDVILLVAFMSPCFFFCQQWSFCLKNLFIMNRKLYTVSELILFYFVDIERWWPQRHSSFTPMCLLHSYTALGKPPFLFTHNLLIS